VQRSVGSSDFIIFIFGQRCADIITTMTVVNVAPLKTPLATSDPFHIEDKKKKK
jgi:hypothetical protein